MRKYLKNKHATVRNVYYPKNTEHRVYYLFIFNRVISIICYQIIQYCRNKGKYIILISYFS